MDAAFSALMRLSLRLLAERNGRAETLRPYLEEPARFYVPSRLLTGAAVVLTGALLAEVIRLDTPQRILGVIASTAAILLVCSVLLPQVIVQRDPERVLDLALPSFAVMARAVHPVTATVLHLASLRRARPAVTPVSAADEEEEQGEAAEAYLEAGEQEGLIETEERRLIQSIVEFGDTLVREVMTPRPDIVAIRDEATLGELRALLREQTYSRIPVFKESLDNVLGFVFVKDLIQIACEDTRAITSLVRPAYFVPETKSVSELLREFQRQQVQIASRRGRVRRHGGPGDPRGPASKRSSVRSATSTTRNRKRSPTRAAASSSSAARSTSTRSATASAWTSSARGSRRWAATCCRTSAACRPWARSSRSTAWRSRSWRPSAGGSTRSASAASRSSGGP